MAVRAGFVRGEEFGHYIVAGCFVVEDGDLGEDWGIYMPRFGEGWVDSLEGGGEFDYGHGEKYLWVFWV